MWVSLEFLQFPRNQAFEQLITAYYTIWHLSGISAPEKTAKKHSKRERMEWKWEK
jgi:hypothetical protein